MARIPLNDPYTVTNGFGVPDPNAAFGKHAGIDYGVPTGRNVYAPTSGTVTDYVWSNYHGNVVQIFDGKYYHRLMHNSQLLVKPGDKVIEGVRVALSGSTGLSTGPHVHWDISPTKVPTTFNFINPDLWLKGASMTDAQLRGIGTAVYRTVFHREPESTTVALSMGKKFSDGVNDADKFFADMKSLTVTTEWLDQDAKIKTSTQYEPVQETLYRKKG